MIQQQSFNIIYLIFIAFILTNTASTMIKKSQLGEELVNIEKTRGITKYIGIGVITVVVVYMIKLSFTEYNLVMEKVVNVDKNKAIFNLVSQIAFWVALYIALAYSQLSKKYLSEEGIALGSKVYRWEQVDKYSWVENNLTIFLQEKFLYKNAKREIFLIIPEEKKKDVQTVLIRKIRFKK